MSAVLFVLSALWKTAVFLTGIAVLSLGVLLSTMYGGPIGLLLFLILCVLLTIANKK